MDKLDLNCLHLFCIAFHFLLPAVSGFLMLNNNQFQVSVIEGVDVSLTCEIDNRGSRITEDATHLERRVRWVNGSAAEISVDSDPTITAHAKTINSNRILVTLTIHNVSRDRNNTRYACCKIPTMVCTVGGIRNYVDLIVKAAPPPNPCEVDQPCVHGTCRQASSMSGFVCDCEDDYEGTTCNQTIPTTVATTTLMSEERLTTETITLVQPSTAPSTSSHHTSLTTLLVLQNRITDKEESPIGNDAIIKTSDTTSRHISVPVLALSAMLMLAMAVILVLVYKFMVKKSNQPVPTQVHPQDPEIQLTMADI